MPDNLATFSRGLACAALSPPLRTVLCLGASDATALDIAELFAELLRAATDRDVHTTVLGPAEHEDALWSTVSWRAAQTGAQIVTVPGPLARDAVERVIVLAVVPDLSRMTLSVVRACVVLAGADVANVERHGMQLRWQPHVAWIAACPRQVVGQVSPHVLDRFAVRLNAPPTPARPSVDELLEHVQGQRGPGESTGVDPELLSVVRRARAVTVTPDAAALDRVLELSRSDGSLGARRDLALARLATEEARLSGAPTMRVDHVEAAAALLGFRAVGENRAIDGPAKPSPPQAGPPPAPSGDAGGDDASIATRLGDEATATELVAVGIGGAPAAFEPAPLTPSIDVAEPYPEDRTPAERDFEPLRLPPRGRDSRRSMRGAVIGTERTTDLRDLTISSTLLETLKFQPARRLARGTTARPGPFLISAGDLRRYCRAPPAEGLLVLVLDYTCRRGGSWTRALRPYLRWAYVERATVCLVKVGARAARDELQAERVVARSLLVPTIARALDEPAGRATPLAHGLDLALQFVRRALHQGREGARSAWIVVVTDGRGNVPLEASWRQSLDERVGQAGVEDALRVAEEIRALPHVRPVIVDTEPVAHRELPHALAHAMGAVVAERDQDEELSARVE